MGDVVLHACSTEREPWAKRQVSLRKPRESNFTALIKCAWHAQAQCSCRCRCTTIGQYMSRTLIPAKPVSTSAQRSSHPLLTL